MPLTFTTKQPPSDKEYSAAEIVELDIDLASKRIQAIVVYGRIDSNVFIRNVNLQPVTYTFDGPTFDTVAASHPDGAKTLYENIKAAIWQLILNAGYESGSIV